MILNIVSDPRSGGAELLVRELHKLYLSRDLNSKVIFLSGSPYDIGSNEEIIGTNCRSPFNIFRIRKQLKRCLKQSKHNLTVHAHLTWPLLYLALATIGLKNLKLVYTEHNTSNKRRKIPLVWLVERLIYRRYSKIICISDGVYESLAKWVGLRLSDRLVTIQNGSRIYQVFERLHLAGRKPRLVSVGSLTFKKNFATAIRAIARLRDEIDSYVIVGEGPERNKLEQLIRREKLGDKVELLGWSDSIEAHLRAADIQVIPSLWEGFGLVAVEGMSTGLPVVASDVAGLREVLDPNNLAVTLIEKVESEDAWVWGLQAAIDNLHSQGPKELARAARTQAEKFTLEKMADQYLEVYREISQSQKQRCSKSL
ncbi:glycosyltransferase family 4 protein [Marinobacter sp. ELB17]|uniref:glycosyltransferase family 4 protein n=1 Tax=Marinobacter sp. ELB17 TaxID=270374 RepID=UPI0000F3A891|nr:glycosyltransferase family 4 protein [Marinobacter sp. ELB17]EAZ98236.1 putative lipopolysaccharide biosynthesis protein [Marinobacter sp. ELB17]